MTEMRLSSCVICAPIAVKQSMVARISSEKVSHKTVTGAVPSAAQTVPLDYSALPGSVLLEKGAGAGLRAELTLPEALEAPVQRGQSVGKVEIYAGDTLLSEAEVTAAADAPVLTFGDALELLWQSLLGA